MIRRELRAYWSLVRRSDLALGYSAVLVVVAVVLALLPDDTHRRIIQQSSTNLSNLRLHPIQVLVVSAFVVSSLGGLWQLPVILGVYAAAQRWVGRVVALFVAVLGHVGATLFVASVLASGVANGRLSHKIAHVSDVGYSYALACLAAFVVSLVPRRWRIWYVIALIADFLGPSVFGVTFTDLGHTTALILGFGLALLAFRVRRAGSVQAGVAVQARDHDVHDEEVERQGAEAQQVDPGR